MEERRYRYRVEVFDAPRGGWRDTYAAAEADAIRLELASYDSVEGEWFLAVPVSIRKEPVP